jgi:hypothetical protein
MITEGLANRMHGSPIKRILASYTADSIRSKQLSHLSTTLLPFLPQRPKMRQDVARKNLAINLFSYV